MVIPDHIRSFLREAIDDPKDGGGKVVAHKIGIDRVTLYRVIGGTASCMTVRRILRAFPNLQQIQHLNA